MHGAPRGDAADEGGLGHVRMAHERWGDAEAPFMSVRRPAKNSIWAAAFMTSPTISRIGLPKSGAGLRRNRGPDAREAAGAPPP